MVENFNKSSNVLGFGFHFDIVIAHLSLTNVDIQEISKVKIYAKFFNSNIQITSSRINVNEFKAGHSVEFTERPTVLKDKLIKNPLECQLCYDDKPVGICTFSWPDSFTNCIGEGCGRELTCCVEADVKKENTIVGHMEIIAQLLMKCHEFEEVQMTLEPKINFCKTADGSLNRNDVLFVVGGNKYGSIACADVNVIPGSESGTSANATYLDLTGFQHVHGKTLSNTNILDTIDGNCCKIQKSSNRYEDMIKNLLNKSKEFTSYSTTETKTNQPQMQFKDVRTEKEIPLCRSSSISGSSTDSHERCVCLTDESANEMPCQKNGVIEKPIKRYCPLCNNNITWLPNFSPCPKCGFKPFLHELQEKSYDGTLTAHEILQAYNSNNNNADNDICINYGQQTNSCRCTCKDDQICAHCRVKNICKDIFPSMHAGDGDCGKCDVKSSDLYNICKTASTKNQGCQSYLAKAFQELNDLYDNIETQKSSKNVKNACELQKIKKDLQNSQRSPYKEENLQAERKNIFKKNFLKPECKNYLSSVSKKQLKSNVTKIGHESCFTGHTFVPHNMGWLWNAEATGLRTGWMPGAIRKPIKLLMEHFLNNTNNMTKQRNNENNIKEEPTLHVCKKNRAYYITLRPIKYFGSINECTESFNMKPIQFKIIQSLAALGMSQVKQHLKTLGFAKCVCHKPIASCCCRSYLEKKKLEYRCWQECNKKELPNCSDKLILSDTSDSEAEFEFGVTPPAAVMIPPATKKQVNTGTQYVEDDWQVIPEPLKTSGKLYNCAIGNRYGSTFGPYGIKGYGPGAVPKEIIHAKKSCGGRVAAHRKGESQRDFRNLAIKGTDPFRDAKGIFNMAQYVAYKALTKPSRNEIAKRKKQKMSLLKGTNPPLLCKVDRRGKPMNTCFPKSDNRIC